jgi:hypothetical protein
VNAQKPATNNIKPGTDSGGWEPKRQPDCYGTSGDRSRCAADNKTIKNDAVSLPEAFSRLRKSRCKITMLRSHLFSFILFGVSANIFY